MSKKIHFFDQQLAKSIGQDEAILFYQIKYWISKCGKSINGHEGAWIYNSLKQWHSEHFNYWSMYKLRKTIKSLENNGLIKSTKANSKKWNHTKWYSINEEEYNSLFGCSYQNKKESSLNTRNISPLNQTVDKACQASDSTNRFVDHRQIINIQNNNYTKNLSYKEKQVTFRNEEQDSKEPLKDRHNVSNHEIESFTIESKKFLVIKDMVNIWNEEFSKCLDPIKGYINKKLAEKLYILYENIFASDLEKWRDYARKVISSKFLMGEKKTSSNFKAVFPWLIKQEVVENVLSGAYGIGDRISDVEREKMEEKRRAEIKKLHEIRKEEELKKKEKKIRELAAELEREDFKKKESCWTQEQHEEAKRIFERELYSQEDKYGIGHCRDIFEVRKWADPIINFAFTGFKRAYYSKNTEEFIEEAKNIYYSKHKTESRSLPINNVCLPSRLTTLPFGSI